MRLMFFIIPFLPIAATIGAQLAQTVVSGMNNRKMLRYNSPKAQISRLRAAGLPFAAFTAGQAGNQSSLPDVSGIGAAGNTLSSYFGSRNDQQDYRVKKNLADVSDADTRALLEGTYEMFGQKDMNPVEIKRKLEAITNIYALDNAANEQLVKQIEYSFKQGLSKEDLRKKWDAEIDKLLIGNKLGNQVFDNTEKVTAARNTIIDQMMEGGLGFGEALLMVLMQSLSGSVGDGGWKIGM